MLVEAIVGTIFAREYVLPQLPHFATSKQTMLLSDCDKYILWAEVELGQHWTPLILAPGMQCDKRLEAAAESKNAR